MLAFVLLRVAFVHLPLGGQFSTMKRLHNSYLMEGSKLKKWVQTLLLVTLMFALVACGSNNSSGNNGNNAAPVNENGANAEPEQTGDSKEEVEIRFAWWGSDALHEKWNQVADLFEKKYPHITVTTEFGGWGSYWDKLTTQVAGGNAPDVFYMHMDQFDNYAQRGALLELDPYIESGQIDLSDFEQSVIDIGEMDDNIYMVNVALSLGAVAYNADLLKEANLPEPTFDWTWDEFVELAKKSSEALGGDVYGTTDLGWDASWLHVYLRQHGKELYTTDGKLAFGKEDLTAWLTMWDDLRESGAAPPAEYTEEERGKPAEDNIMVRRNVVFKPESANQIMTLQSHMEDELKLTNFPQVEGKGSALTPRGVNFAIYAKSKHPEEAALFMDYVFNDPEVQPVLGGMPGVPGSSKMVEAVKPFLDETQQKFMDYVNRVSPTISKGVSRPAQSNEIFDLVRASNEQIAFGVLSIEEAVDEFFNKAEAALSQ